MSESIVDMNERIETAIQVEHLSFAYTGDNVLCDVSFSVRSGSFLGILGTNGSGKSTLLSCIDGLLRPQQGRVLVQGRDLGEYSRIERAQTIAYVTQHSHANQLTVYDALLLGRKPYVTTAPSADDYAKVDEVIERLNLQSLALRFVDELSGGEYQKMIIARALVQDTDILLLDEPTNNLDLANQYEVLDLVREQVAAEGKTVIAVMHDINAALRYVTEFLFLKEGRVWAQGGIDIVTAELISDVYGVSAELIHHDGKPFIITE